MGVCYEANEGFEGRGFGSFAEALERVGEVEHEKESGGFKYCGEK